MNDDSSNASQGEKPQPRWQPAGAIDRRVIGVLAEKAKTTPDGYPMSLNAIRNACNQKSNRAPLMNLEADDVEESLERMRQLGAVGMIEGYGRVAKYRHYLYDWLGVDKVELAVMAELLLRGPQTEGELRGRASRMESIKDLSELRPVIDALKERGLVIPLTPKGRGHVVAHAVYREPELEKIRAQYGPGVPADSRVPAAAEPVASTIAEPEPADVPAETRPAPAAAGPAIGSEVVDALRREIAELRSQIAQLRSDVDDLGNRQSRVSDDLRDLRDSLGA